MSEIILFTQIPDEKTSKYLKLTQSGRCTVWRSSNISYEMTELARIKVRVETRYKMSEISTC